MRRPPEGANLRELIGILQRRRASLLIGLILTTGLAIAYLALTPSLYTATTSILIDARLRSPLGEDLANVAASSPDAVLIESQVRVIASDAVLARVVEAEHLDQDNDFASTRPGVISQILQALTIAKPSAGPSDASARALLALARNVIVKRSERTYVIDIDVSARDPQKAARLANALASAYIADRAANKAQAAKANAAALNARLSELQRKLSEAETRVQQYKQSHQIYDANGKRINEQELTEGATSLSLARAKTSDAKARYDQIQRIIVSGRPTDAVTESLKSNLIDRLRSQYADIARQEANYRTTLGDRHPALIETQNQLREIRALITEELKRIAAGAANEYQTARATELGVERQLGQIKKGSDVTSLAAVELRELEHDVDASKAVYDKFLRARDAMGVEEVEGQFARIIAPAVPPAAASSPKTATILALAMASGLFGGAAQAFLAEYLSNGAPEPERSSVSEAPAAIAPRRRGFKLWPLGGAGKPNGELPAAPLALEPAPARAEPDPHLLTFYQKLVATAWPIEATSAPFTILITSLEDGAGKTQTSLALARIAAAQGKRVLIIDANNNRPALLAYCDTASPELIDLMGALRPCHALTADPYVKAVPISDGEIWQVRRLSRRPETPIIDGIADHFDLVILDGATIGPDADMAMVAAAADRVVIASAEPAPDRVRLNAALEAIEVGRHRFAGVWATRPNAAAAA